MELKRGNTKNLDYVGGWFKIFFILIRFTKDNNSRFIDVSWLAEMETITGKFSLYKAIYRAKYGPVWIKFGSFNLPFG